MSSKLKLVFFGAFASMSSALQLRMEEKTHDEDAKSEEQHQILLWNELRKQIEIAEHSISIADMSTAMAQCNRDTGFRSTVSWRKSFR